MFEHNELNPNESEARSGCCPVNYHYPTEMLGEKFRYGLEKDITVERNATFRKWFFIPNLRRGFIQVYLEPEDTPYIKVSNLNLFEIELRRDRDWDVPPHLRNSYSVEMTEIEEFESGEVIEIPLDCGCGYEVQGDIEIFVPDSVAPHTLDVKMVIDTGAGSNQKVPLKLVII
ncbi:hypothetical protein [Peribacillus sp. FSL R5-0717]|uniref:hypothetical protein n=1 Tax=Peribacillus sp. FSL R5-0717 TaxID=2975308 RepID=UPI0030F8AE30